MQLGLGISLVQGVAPAAAAPAGYFTYSLSSGASALVACSQNETPVAYYSADATLGVGSLLFTNTSLTTPAPDEHYSNGTTYFRVESGALLDDPSVTICEDILLPEILLNFSENGPAGTCAIGPGQDPYYIDEGETHLHLDPYGLTFAPDGDYSDGTVYYQVVGGGGGYTGPIACPEE